VTRSMQVAVGEEGDVERPEGVLTPTVRIRVFVIAGVRLYREGIARALARLPDMDLAGSAADAAEALEPLARLRPDVVIVDASMASPADTLRKLGRAARGTRMLALAVDETDVGILAAAEAGVAGFLTREQSLAELEEAVRAVARGETLCSPRHTAALLQRVGALALQLEDSAADESPLTHREREILALMSTGLSNKEIATELVIEVGTVKNHVHNVLRKLQVRRRGEAVALARAERHRRLVGAR
jgi:two-component system nitrate/nitrite response regulator NarL